MANAGDASVLPPIDFQMLLDAFPEPTAVVDRKGRFVAANRALRGIMRSAVGREIHPLGDALSTVPPDLRPEVERAIERVFEGQVWTKDHPVRNRIYEYLFSPVRGPDGSVVAALIRSRDVTDREYARKELEAFAGTLEEKVRVRTRELASFLETTREGFATFGPGGAFTQVNDAYCTMVGFSRKELLRMNIRDVDFMLKEPQLANLGDLVRQTGVALIETAHQRKDGRVIEAEVSLSWADVSGGQYIAFLRDITERKRADRALAESETRLRRITDHMVDLVAEFDDQARFRYASPSYERLLGYPPAELIGTWAPDKIPLDEQAKAIEAIGAVLNAGKGTVRFRYRHKDGSYRWIESTGTVILDADGTVLGSVMGSRDVTEQVMASDQAQERSNVLRLQSEDLAAAVRQLEAASRAKDEFLASMSHELRTPLNGILGMAEVLGSGIHGNLGERQQRCLRVVEEGGRHLLSLINDILDVAKIEAGRLVLNPEPCSVLGVCRASVAMVQAAAERNRIDLTFDVDRNATPVVADARRLQQILFNLLSNAVKFTPSGGRVSLEARVDPELRQIEFAVSDSGPGIAAEDVGKLFRPFTQLDTRLAREHGGSGLGLALVRHMTQLHGGKVEVRTEPGRGSRFSVLLPWTPRPGGAPSGAAFRPVGSTAPAPSPGRSTSAPTVVLVDDDPAAAEVLTSYLGASGIRLEVATNGPAGLDLVAAVQPDVVLMDIQLPGMDGLEVIRRLKADGDGNGPRVIALTALAMTGDRERMIAAGADDYLSKPVSLQVLEARIRALAGVGPLPGR
jgi:PAS domain S-box-containing protein